MHHHIPAHSLAGANLIIDIRILLSEWTMEQVIGYLEYLIKQPSNPFCNLAAQLKRLAYVNAMISMWPEFNIQEELPRGSEDLSDGYRSLGPKDSGASGIRQLLFQRTRFRGCRATISLSMSKTWTSQR